jgi:hypothetical protein
MGLFNIEKTTTHRETVERTVEVEIEAEVAVEVEAREVVKELVLIATASATDLLVRRFAAGAADALDLADHYDRNLLTRAEVTQRARDLADHYLRIAEVAP